MVTDPHTHKHTHPPRQDRLQYTAPQLASAQCNKSRQNRGVTTDWTVVNTSTPLLQEDVPQIDADPVSFFFRWRDRSIINYTELQLASGCIFSSLWPLFGRNLLYKQQKTFCFTELDRLTTDPSWPRWELRLQTSFRDSARCLSHIFRPGDAPAAELSASQWISWRRIDSYVVSENALDIYCKRMASRLHFLLIYPTWFPSVLWHCWLGDRKDIRPVKKSGVGLLVVTIWLALCTTYSSSCHHHFNRP